MEGGRDYGDGGAAGKELRWWRGAAGGGSGDEEGTSDVSSGGGVELSLRLRTGADDDGGAAAASAPPLMAPAEAEAEARRNMTIFYNGRVCAVDVTEVQARAIMSMASEETQNHQADHRRPQRHQVMVMRGGDGDGLCRRRQQDGDGDSSSSSSAAVASDRGLVRPPAVALAPSRLLAAAGVGVGSPPRQGGGFVVGAAVAAPVVEIDDQAAATGLSMKRSLQLFLQKRKARTAAAVAPPYAAGNRQAQAQAVRR